MTRHVWLVVLCIGVAGVWPAPSAAMPLPRLGVVAGGQLGRFSTMSGGDFSPPASKWSGGGLGGITAAWPLPGRLALASGLEYGELTDHYAMTLVFATTDFVVSGETASWTRQRVLSLPARVEWSPGRWHLAAGPELRYLVRADWRVAVSPFLTIQPALAAARGRRATANATIFEKIRPDRWYEVTDTYRRWSLAGQVAVGRDLPAGRHRLRVDVRWSEGLTDQRHAPRSSQQFTQAVQLAVGGAW